MKNNSMKILFILVRVVAIILLIVAYSNQPIGYYTILRFVVFVVSIYSAYSAIKTKQKIWIWMMFSISVLFNPIFPFYFKREAWEIYDAIAILILLYSLPILCFSIDEDKMIDKFRESTKTIIGGLLLIVGAFFFWLHIAGNIFDELLLIQGSETANGFLISTYEDEHEDERGKVYISEVGVFEFHSPDGRKYYTKTTNPLEENIEVEYLPNNPSVNRAKGDGCQTVIEWLWRKVGIGGIFLILLLSPGFILLKNGVREIKALLILNTKNNLLSINKT